LQSGGVVRQPYGAWMPQVARNLTEGVDGFLIGTITSSATTKASATGS